MYARARQEYGTLIGTAVSEEDESCAGITLNSSNSRFYKAKQLGSSFRGGGGGYRTASKTNLQQGEKKVNIKFNFLAINRKAQKVPMLLQQSCKAFGLSRACVAKWAQQNCTHCNSRQLPIFCRVFFLVPKNTIFAERRRPKIETFISGNYTTRGKGNSRMVQVWVSALRTEQTREVQKEVALPLSKKKTGTLFKALFVEAKLSILIQFTTYLDGRKNTRLDVCMTGLSIRRSKTSAF